MTGVLNSAQRQTICGNSRYVKREKMPNEAPPLAVPVMSEDWPLYVPSRMVPVRAGAENFLRYQSRGM